MTTSINEEEKYEALLMMENQPQRRCNWLGLDQRQEICLLLLRGCNIDMKSKHGLITTVCEKFGTDRQTVRRLWTEAKEHIQQFGTFNVNRRMAGIVGRKGLVLGLSKVRALPMGDRSTVRSLAYNTGYSKTFVHGCIQQGTVRRHSSAIKPHLSDFNKKQRLEWCLEKIETTSMFTNPTLIDFNDYDHVDEKEFYMTQEDANVYLLPDEINPERSCQSKRFITKVMFLVAVARPRFDLEKGVDFDGKIGCWPLVYEEPAKRGSKNKPAETVETKAMLSITRPMYRAYLIEKLLPAIRDKWPHSISRNVIYVQQDNARPHILIDDPEFEASTIDIGLNVKLICQPPNSPNMNILDLGFFRAIGALQQKHNIKDLNELITVVEKAFIDLPCTSLNYVFISLKLCMTEVMKVGGSNGYKIPHINKKGLEKLGVLPNRISMDCDVIEGALEKLLQ